MAYITISEFIDVGTGLQHTATSWQFAKDEEFTKIIDESLEDYVNVKSWNSMLPKLAEDLAEGETYGYYSDLDQIYCRVKVHLGSNDVESAWYVIGPKSQKEQQVVMTDLDGNMTWTNSLMLGWHNYNYEELDDMLKPNIKDAPTATHYEFTITNVSTNNVGIQKGAFESSDYCILTGQYYKTSFSATVAYDEVTTEYITSADPSDLVFDFSSVYDKIYEAVSNGETQVTTTLSEVSNIRELQYQYLLRGYNTEHNGFEYAEALTASTVIQINIGSIEEVDGNANNSVEITTELETEYVNFFNGLYVATNIVGTVYKQLIEDHEHPDDGTTDEEEEEVGEEEVDDNIIDTSGRHYEFNIANFRLHGYIISADALNTNDTSIILSGNTSSVVDGYVKQTEACSLVIDSDLFKSKLETYINEEVTYLSDIKNFNCDLGDISNISELTNQYALTGYVSDRGFSTALQLSANTPVGLSLTDLSIVSGTLGTNVCNLIMTTDDSLEPYPGLKYVETPISCQFNIVGRTTTIEGSTDETSDEDTNEDQSSEEDQKEQVVGDPTSEEITNEEQNNEDNTSEENVTTDDEQSTDETTEEELTSQEEVNEDDQN